MKVRLTHMLSRRSLLLALAGSAMLPFPARAQSDWKTYRHPRLGTTIEYPADRFIPTPTPENSAGQRFVASDGAEFTVGAINNVFHQNLAGLEASVLKGRAPDERIRHRDKGANWLVVSGTRGDAIFYERHLISHRGAIINDFEILFPVRLKRLYDPIVARMSRSFRAGVGVDTGPP